MELQEYNIKLQNWFQEQEENMLKRLEVLVNLHSFSHDGDCVNKVGEQISAWLKEDGFIVEKIPKVKPFVYDDSMEFVEKLGNVFVARTHEKNVGAGIVFLAHMDTVFPKEMFWSFRMDIENDKAYGPGINDMKGGIIINMFVAKALKELNLISCPITLTFSPDEEIGSLTTLPILKKELKGAITAICTEPGYLGGGVTTKRKGAGHVRLHVTGRTAHAGRDYVNGASAILELSHKIIALDKYVDLENDQTVNVGLIHGGTSANSVAGEAYGAIHFTYPNLESGENLLNNIKKECEQTYIDKTHCFLSGGLGLPPLTETKDNKTLYSFVEKAGEVMGYPVFSNPSKGAAESGFCSSILGIPSVCSMGVEGEFLHSKNEYIKLSSLIPRSKLVALTAIMAANYWQK